MDIFSLSQGDVAPGKLFARMEMPRSPRGLPEGIHSGGPFSDGYEAWKPLDALPDPTAQYRVRTLEDEILEEMHVASPELFPRNWRVEERHGRRFLVRPLLRVVPYTYLPERITRKQVLRIEQMVRVINERWWWINDHLNIAFDASDQPLILDLSSAGRANPRAQGIFQPDEENLFHEWAESVAGDEPLVRLRRTARHLVSSIHWAKQERAAGRDKPRRWVYIASHARLQPETCEIRDSKICPVESESPGSHSWCVVPGPLGERELRTYELELGWAPLQYNPPGNRAQD